MRGASGILMRLARPLSTNRLRTQPDRCAIVAAPIEFSISLNFVGFCHIAKIGLTQEWRFLP